MLVIGKNIAEQSEALQDFIFWRINANGSATPFVLQTPVRRGGERRARQRRPDVPILGNRYRITDARPGAKLVAYSGPDAPRITSADLKDLVTVGRFPAITDYSGPRALGREIYELYNGGMQEIYFLRRRQPEFVFDGETTLADGVATIRPAGSQRAGQDISGDASYTLNFEIYLGGNLEQPGGYLFTVTGVVGDVARVGNINFNTSHLRLPASIDRADRAAIGQAANIAGRINVNGFTIDIENIYNTLETLEILPVGMPRDFSVVYSGSETATGDIGLVSFDEIEEKKEGKRAGLSIINFDDYANRVGVRAVMLKNYLLKAYRGRRFFAEDWQRVPGTNQIELVDNIEISLEQVKRVFPNMANVRQTFRAWKERKVTLLMEK